MIDTKLRTIVLGLAVALAAAACSGGAGGGGGSAGATTITMAAVDNPQMQDLQKLLPEFESAHSNIHVNIVTLPEDQLRLQRNLPPRSSGLGRAARSARHGGEHVRRTLVRPELERPADDAGVA